MATATLVPLSEYLRSSYEPDAEFVDGVIEERAIGQRDHSDLQSWLMLLLGAKANWAQFLCRTEQRVQTSRTRYRIPDLALLRAGAPREQVVLTPPLLCVEILSPEDTMHRLLVRVRDFLAMGVPEVWIFDPESRTVQICAGTSISEQAEGFVTVPGSSVRIEIAEVFSVLDQ